MPENGQPIYIVSGFPRSGTSMMMQCLEAGGIPCAYHKSADDEWAKKFSGKDYQANPNGFYEFDNLHNIKDWSIFRGKALKIIRGNLSFLPIGEKLKIIYCKRNWQEIWQSCKVSGVVGNHESSCDFLFDYDTKSTNDISKLLGAGHQVIEIGYSDVIANPLEAMQVISAAGFPIDAEKAATVVDARLHRNKGGVLNGYRPC